MHLPKLKLKLGFLWHYFHVMGDWYCTCFIYKRGHLQSSFLISCGFLAGGKSGPRGAKYVKSFSGFENFKTLRLDLQGFVCNRGKKSSFCIWGLHDISIPKKGWKRRRHFREKAASADIVWKKAPRIEQLWDWEEIFQGKQIEAPGRPFAVICLPYMCV